MNVQATATAVALTVGTASAAIRVYLVATRLSDRGQLYQVRLHDAITGRIIAHGVLDPEHAACRSLLRLGYRGYLEIWSADGITLRWIIKDIAKSAGILVGNDHLAVYHEMVRGKLSQSFGNGAHANASSRDRVG